MNIFNYFNKKKREAEQAKPVKPKVFTFTTYELACVGDHYTYDVTADTKKEAFKKLVIYFYGSAGTKNDIKSHAQTITRDIPNSFGYTGMPRWFAKRISGNVRGQGYDYQKELEDYAKENDIKLSKDY